MSPILLLDNFDSFTFNIFHGLVRAGARVEVRRCDAVDLTAIQELAPSMIVLSPGPGRPEDASLSLEAVHRFAGVIPMFGICLGMQVIAVALGGAVGSAPEPVHGKVSQIDHDGQGLFQGLPSPLSVGRYHSLCVKKVPECLHITARTIDGLIMGFRHRHLPIAGLQFHPDSFLTEQGQEMLQHAIHGRF